MTPPPRIRPGSEGLRGRGPGPRRGASVVARVSLGLGVALGIAAAIAPESAAEGPKGPPAAPAPDGGASARFVGTVRPPDLDDVEHMCALLTGCKGLPFPTGFVPRDLPGCVKALADELASPRAASFSLSLKECGLRASSCGELRTCALRGARPDVCAGRGKAGAVDHCDDGGRAITCAGEKPVLVRDCPRGGEQCAVVAGKATCALGTCEADAEADAAPACSASGTRIVECRKGKLLSSDCNTFGLKCSVGPDGPQCVSPTPACAGEGTTCDGSVAVSCWRGHEVRVDCGAAGLACGASASGRAMGSCVVPPPSGAACDPKAPARCDGASLSWCAWGKPRSYLCKSMGLARCVSDDKGARCAP